MKKILVPLFSFLLVFTLLLGSFGSAKAEVGDDPVVTPVSGDMEFTTEVVPISSLPGLAEYKQMLVPAGFPEGEAQFEGAGVLVKSIDFGKATACFTLSTIAVNQGWGGKVGVWNGTKWLLLPTTITTATDEAANTTACATINGNGYYTFIKWVTAPEKLPVSVPSCGPMASAGPWIASFGSSSGWMTEGYIWREPIVPIGTMITYQILDVMPAGTFYTGLSGTGIVTDVEEVFPGVYISIVTFDPMINFTYSSSMDTFTYRVFTPDCYTDFHFPEDLLN